MNARASNLVAIGASAGGLEPLKALAAGLADDLEAAVAVVQHVSPQADSRLPAILDRAGPLAAAHAEDGQELLAGHIYVAPPDRHLLVRDGLCAVVRGPRENGVRPSVDVLFRSAAVAFGRRAVGVVLSGARDDGTAGASAISHRGGCVFVQDPGDAEFPGMPQNAIAADHPDRILGPAELAAAVNDLVIRLSQEDAVNENGREDEMTLETSYAELDRSAIADGEPPGRSSPFSCPACGGVLWEIDDDELLRFRCRVGHAYTADRAFTDQSEAVDAALWASLRALLERASLAHRLSARARERGSDLSSRRFEERAQEALGQAEQIRTLLLERNGGDD